MVERCPDKTEVVRSILTRTIPQFPNSFILNLLRVSNLKNLIMYFSILSAKMGYIYKITNTVNNKVYIGETRQDDVQTRWNSHKKSVKYGNGCPLLMAAFRKYGIDKFKFEIIVICFDEARFEMEKYYIKKYNTFGENGYNATAGGEGGGAFTGKKHTPENVAKMIERNTNFYKIEENRKALSEKLKEKYRTDPTYREKISAYQKERVRTNTHNLQKPKTNETKTKIQNSLKKYYTNNDTNQTTKEKMSARAIERIGRPVDQFDINNNFIKSFKCIKEAALSNGLKRGTIQAALLRESNITGGFMWKYASKSELKDI
jgi:group I intron endonuclease